MTYTKEEKKILSFFFTNLDKPVFAAKNFHPEVWALMQARYSRSVEGLREGFLNLLKEDPENYNLLLQEIEKTGGGAGLAHATDAAIKFMEKWVLGYGHSSVAEGAVVGIGIEGVSILATKVIEDNRLSSFCEKSTRYVSFDEDSFYMDPSIESSQYADDVRKLMTLLFSTYKELHEPVLEYVKEAVPFNPPMSKPAWERACAARRFDSIRYLLPAATKTSFGWTVNARQLAHGISKMLSHPLAEMNDIGMMLKEEASIALPSLLKYADKKPFFTDTEHEMQILAAGIDIDKGRTASIALVQGPENADDIIVSAILYRYKNDPFKKIMETVKGMTRDEKLKLFDTYMSKMGRFDSPLRELEHVQFTFDLTMDYGSFRDMQRHRMTTQTCQLLTTNLGYDIPGDIRNSGMSEKYCFAMDQAKRIFERVAEKYPDQAQYLVPLGFKKRFLMTFNLRQAYHMIRLRSSPQGHESYRILACGIYDTLKEKYPLLTKYIACDLSDLGLGRLKAEEKTEKMRKSI